MGLSDTEGLGRPSAHRSPSIPRALENIGTVARANIEHYRKLLAKETDETKRQTLERLLAEEEAKLNSLTQAPTRKRSLEA